MDNQWTINAQSMNNQWTISEQSVNCISLQPAVPTYYLSEACDWVVLISLTATNNLSLWNINRASIYHNSARHWPLDNPVSLITVFMYIVLSMASISHWPAGSDSMVQSCLRSGLKTTWSIDVCLIALLVNILRYTRHLLCKERAVCISKVCISKDIKHWLVMRAPRD